MFRIKICGVTSPADALAAVEAGADAIGLNFFPQSPRYVQPSQAAEIAAVIPPRVARVGVFVEPDPHAALQFAESLSLDYLQVHGAIEAGRIAELGAARVIVAVPFSPARLDELRAAVECWRVAGCLPAALLIDADRAGMHGGTGQAIDWDLAAMVREELSDLPIVLAGGLRPENVREAVMRARPHAVDVASGVEASPGQKSTQRMRQFVEGCAALGAEPPAA